ncbi:hypothetical protein ACN9JU_01650 [Aliarcobacter butzleri]|uniref:hypothetical protein n=1 Tax=Aliarcobacter butzleri TaxID=28197 RepID=UPI003B21C788
MNIKAKNNNLELHKVEQQNINKKLIEKAIKHIQSLGGIINYSMVSQVTYDIADGLKKEKGISSAGISKNPLYRTMIEQAKLYQSFDDNLGSNKRISSNNANGNLTIVDIKLQLHELRIKNVNLKMENKILKDQMLTLNIPAQTVNSVNEEIVKKYKYFSQICSNMISRLLELEIAYLDLDNTTLNVQMYDDVILQKEPLELLYKDKLNELKNDN